MDEKGKVKKRRREGGCDWKKKTKTKSENRREKETGEREREREREATTSKSAVPTVHPPAMESWNEQEFWRHFERTFVPTFNWAAKIKRTDSAGAFATFYNKLSCQENAKCASQYINDSSGNTRCSREVVMMAAVLLLMVLVVIILRMLVALMSPVLVILGVFRSNWLRHWYRGLVSWCICYMANQPSRVI